MFYGFVGRIITIALLCLISVYYTSTLCYKYSSTNVLNHILLHIFQLILFKSIVYHCDMYISTIALLMRNAFNTLH